MFKVLVWDVEFSTLVQGGGCEFYMYKSLCLVLWFSIWNVSPRLGRATFQVVSWLILVRV